MAGAKRSGLGLAVVASIVHVYQGTIAIASDHEKGTEVELRLRLAADPTLDRNVMSAAHPDAHL